MHVQIATYTMPEISDDEFTEVNQEFASMMAEVPGLLAKIWLKAPNGSVYGGVYLWQDRQAHEEFVGGELWASVLSDDSMSDLQSHDYDVMEELTKATQPRLKAV